MKRETLLPFDKVDPGSYAQEAALDIATSFDDTKRVEALGFHGLVVGETKDESIRKTGLQEFEWADVRDAGYRSSPPRWK